MSEQAVTYAASVTAPTNGNGCRGCGAPLGGRKDRRFCSPACKQAAYRRRTAVPVEGVPSVHESRLFRGDARTILPRLPLDVGALATWSPPYNVGWAYGDDDGSGDRLGEPAYLGLLRDAIEGCWRVLRPGGVLVINVPSSIAIKAEHGWGETIRAYPLAARLRCFLLDRRPDWLLHDTHVWDKIGPDGASKAMVPVLGTYNNFWSRPVHEELVIASKLTYRTAKRAWTMPEYREALKTVHRWPHGKGGRGGEPPTFPDELVGWCLQLFTNPGDLVVDVFAGSGTTGRVARSLGRPCWLIEREPSYWPRLEGIVGQGSLSEVAS